jgi:SEC-C motif-containing protein
MDTILQKCPCESGVDFPNCCEPFLQYKTYPETPEALMRSRYTAYFNGNLDYIKTTMRGKALSQFNKQHASKNPVAWIGLKILAIPNNADPNIGYVEFIATFKKNNIIDHIHELSKFHREEGRWYYVDGEHF